MEAITTAAWTAAGATALVRLWYFAMERGQLLHGYERGIRALLFHAGALRRKAGRWRRAHPYAIAPLLRALYKPLGGCIYCSAVWATAFAARRLPFDAWAYALGFAFVWTAIWLKIAPAE
ncbi:MAG: hypothetical protein RMM53_07950 [Bacteroidia bacterium]|nr:hypothetical protein [Bacteroidia bacterium]MDW8334133.1 hypothetical protein [Bacteroidia bacterium]